MDLEQALERAIAHEDSLLHLYEKKVEHPNLCVELAAESREAATVLRTFKGKGLPFYRAAEIYAAWCDTSRREIAEIDTSKTFAWINQLGEKQHLMRAAYRAAKEGK